MYYSVQASLCKHLIAEDAVPVGDSQLAGQDQRFSVIPVIDYLLEVVLLLVLTENMFQDCLSDVSFIQSHSGMEAITMLHVEGIREYCARYNDVVIYAL